MAKDELLYERLTESIIGAFYEVYNRLGYGFLENAKPQVKRIASSGAPLGPDSRVVFPREAGPDPSPDEDSTGNPI